MSDDLQSKQAYLRENVLEMGYDADEFMTFLQTKKGENGLDLNNWSMNELIKFISTGGTGVVYEGQMRKKKNKQKLAFKFKYSKKPPRRLENGYVGRILQRDEVWWYAKQNSY